MFWMFYNFNKTIGLIRKLQITLPRPSLSTIYKSFLRPHLYNGDIIYDQANKESFQQKVESIQYNIALVITGAFRGGRETFWIVRFVVYATQAVVRKNMLLL